MQEKHSTKAQTVQAESALDRPLDVAEFGDRRAIKMRSRTLSLRDLSTGLPAAVSKDSMRHIKLGRFTGETTAKGSYRHNAAHDSVSGIEGDYDAGTMTVKQAAAALEYAGVAAMIYTTPSHQQDGKGHRWRVLCPLSADTTPANRQALLARVNGVLGGTLSAESFTPAQSYAFGAVKGEPAPKVQLVEGRFLDHCADLDANAIGKPAPDRGEPQQAADLSHDAHRVERAAAMLEASAQRLADTTVARNEALCREAFLMGGLVANCLLDREQVMEALLPVMIENGFLDDHAKGDVAEVERIIDAQLLTGAREPFDPAPINADDFDDDGDDEPEESTGRFDIYDLLGPPPDDAAQIYGLPYLTPGQCADLPARDYVVKRLIAPRQIGCIFGEPGAGKSLIAPRMAYEIAIGESTFGLRTKAGPVFYVACEDQDGMAGRVAALHMELGDADTFHLFNTVSDLFSPGTIKGKGSPDLEALRKAAKTIRPKLIVIDTLAMAMPGLEENDAAGMNRVVQIGKRLAHCGAAVVFVHHGTKAEGNTPRGHSVFNGALDFSIMVKAADKAGIVRGVIRKNRNGPPDLDIAFKIGSHRVGIDVDGEPVDAPICLPCDPGQADATESKLTETEEAAFNLFLEMEATGPVDETEWRKRATDEYHVSASDDRDNRRRTVTRALKGLIGKRKVIIENGQMGFPHSVESSDWDDDSEEADQ
ncbi:AAA family ATPase [Sulfitobacter sp. F26169L]|uniref:AAA family ATPase n=1 Tax=Sulfitobacter sp. F26169L TaxID=2996015 RepID=UPI002260F43E|nr:AAA family ATPase [Sulfitobacter sp. F26169L]MCX7567123.1 AAA family ATPase [Sulfitobacter sp. F26169L]